MLRQNFSGAELAQWATMRYGGRTAGASVLALKLNELLERYVQRRHVARWMNGQARIPEGARAQILDLSNG